MRFCDRRPLVRFCLRRAGFVMLAALAVSAAACSGARAAAISFAPPVTYAKPGVMLLLAADLDGDGNLDLAVTGGGSVSFFYGKGDGTFEPRVDLPLGDGLHDIQAADLNGDGRPDLVITQNNTVLVLLSQGPRTYAPPVSYQVGTPPCGVTVADLNGDGFPDLAVSNAGSNNICVLLNKGDGTFAPPVFYPAGQVPGQIITADLQGNGLLDLAVANIVSGSVLLYPGNGQGQFTVGSEYGVGPYSGQVVADDFNGDGKLDLATSNWMGSSISILFGDGSGALAPAIFYPGNTYPSEMASADLNGDGAPDLVTGDGGSNYFTVHQNAGDGTFLPPVTFPAGGSDVRSLVVGDFNGDGLPDVVTGNWSDGTISICLNNTPLPSPAIRWLTLDTTTPVGGSRNINGTITLTAAAPSGGAVVALSTNNPALTIPPTVTIPEGQTAAGVTLVTAAVAAPQHGSVLASYNGTAKRAAVTVRAPSAGETTAAGALAAPTGLVAAAVTLGQVNLSWTDPLAPRVPGTGETGFEIQRQADSGDWTTVGTAPAGSSAFTDTTVAQGAHYLYRVRATGPDGPSAWSNEAGVVTAAVPEFTFGVASYDFGPALVESAAPAQSIPVTNSGHAPLVLLDFATFGAQAGDFRVSAAPTTIAPGETGSIRVVFEPSGAGLRSAFLRVADNAPGSLHVLKLTGTGVPPQAAYVIVDLGADLGTPIADDADLFSGPLRLSLNASGVVAGWIPLPNGSSHAAINDATGTHDLGTLPDYPNQSLAAGINNAGQVVGVSQIDSGSHGHAFLYTGGAMQELNTPGLAYVAAHGINDTGEVVGLASTLTGPEGAFLYDSTGLHNLGDLGGGSSDAFAINHAGLVVGWALTADHHQHAFLFDSAGMHDLGTLPGGQTSTALAINDAGQIVGQSFSSATQYGHAFLVDPLGMHDLGTLGGFGSIAYGINNLEQVVGASEVSQGSGTVRHAFEYSVAWTDLNSLLPANSGWVLNEADAINDAGQIVGLGTLNGQPHAFLLTFPTDPRATPPQAPTGLSVTTASTSELDLAWTGNSSNQFGFEIQRKTAGGDWTKVGVTAAKVTTFSDTGLTAYTHYTYRVRAVNGSGASDWSNEASGDTGTQGKLTLVSDALDFGSQAMDTPSAPRTVTLTNSGNGPLTINSLSIAGNVAPPVTTGAPATGSNPGEFAISPAVTTPTTLAPGASLPVSLVFTPAAIGPRAAALTIADDAPGGGATVGLTGSGSGPIVRVMPNALNFGDEPVGLGTALAVLIQNKGNAPLTVSNITFQGANAGDFSLATDGVIGQTLQPGDITLLNIRFSPTATGSRSATLVLTDDAADSPQSIPLTGTGTAPLMRLSADSLIFGLQSGSSTQTLTLTNNGDATLNIQGLEVTGPDAGHFKIVSDTGEQSLPVGGSRTVQIAFQTATVAGAPHHARIAAVSYSATLEIHDNDPHPTTAHTVSLLATSDPGAAADTTPPPPPPGFTPATPPAAPTGLSAHAPSAGEVDLAWSDHSSNEQAFAIWRTGGGQDWARVGIMGPHATSYTDTTVQPGVSYTYKVRAIGGGGASAWSNTVVLAPGAPPAAPTGLTASAAAGTGVALMWSNHSTDEQAFAIWRQGGGQDWARVGIVGPGATTYTDAAVQPGTAYTYQVRAINRFGASDWSNTVNVTAGASAPAAPSGLAASVAGGQASLTWTDNSSDEQAFAIWRQGGGQDWVRIGIMGPHATSYTDTTASPNTAYSYKVRAINRFGASGWSNTVSVTTGAAPPAAPSALAATVTGGQVTLTWTNASTDAHAFAIWRQGGGQEWARVGIAGPQATSYTDSGLTAGASYTYRVRAIGAGGASGWSNAVSVLVPAAP